MLRLIAQRKPAMHHLLLSANVVYKSVALFDFNLITRTVHQILTIPNIFLHRNYPSC